MKGRHAFYRWMVAAVPPESPAQLMAIQGLSLASLKSQGQETEPENLLTLAVEQYLPPIQTEWKTEHLLHSTTRNQYR